MTKETYEILKKKYGDVSSFAIWRSVNNISDISMFNGEEILKKINENYIFIALNPAEHPKSEEIRVFGNFHSSYRYQRDYKLCYALKGTKYYGAYITDLFKSFRYTNRADLKKALKEREKDIKNDFDSLLEEIEIINKEAVLVFIGKCIFHFFNKYFKNKIINKTVYITHFSYVCGKEWYRETINNQIESQI